MDVDEAKFRQIAIGLLNEMMNTMTSEKALWDTRVKTQGIQPVLMLMGKMIDYYAFEEIGHRE